jgi:hypothetical protein
MAGMRRAASDRSEVFGRRTIAKPRGRHVGGIATAPKVNTEAWAGDVEWLVEKQRGAGG